MQRTEEENQFITVFFVFAWENAWIGQLEQYFYKENDRTLDTRSSIGCSVVHKARAESRDFKPLGFLLLKTII